MKRTGQLIFSASVLAIFASPIAAATTIYTDRTAFEIATGASLSFEDFNDGVLDGFTATTDAGFINGTGQWRDRPTASGDSTTFTFGSGITAFGGDYDLSPGGAGTGLVFTLDGTEVIADEVVGSYSGFYGFVSDSAFSTVTVSSGSGIGIAAGFTAIAETHDFDNFSFGTAAPVAPVPLPAGLPLLLAAFAAAFGVRHLGRQGTATA